MDDRVTDPQRLEEVLTEADNEIHRMLSFANDIAEPLGAYEVRVETEVLLTGEMNATTRIRRVHYGDVSYEENDDG